MTSKTRQRSRQLARSEVPISVQPQTLGGLTLTCPYPLKANPHYLGMPIQKSPTNMSNRRVALPIPKATGPCITMVAKQGTSSPPACPGDWNSEFPPILFLAPYLLLTYPYANTQLGLNLHFRKIL